MIRTWLVALALFGLTIAVFWPVREYGFVSLDDLDNVARNPLVYEGMTPGGLKAALTTTAPDYWRPLSWVSFMIDTELYGAAAQPTTNPEFPREIPNADARGYHQTNAILHGLAAVMLLFALRALTGCFWRSVIVAFIFAVHPLRVESVAWITERKDVLSGIFAFGTLWAYAKYGHGSLRVPRPSFNWLWLALATGLLCMGLMSKSTLVTLPMVLLLLDYWPLKRIDLAAPWTATARRIGWLVAEKIPLFAAAAGSCWMTLHGGNPAMADLPQRLRLSNAIVSYVRYIGKMFWPVDLAVYYPLPGMGGADPWTRMQVIGALTILLLITIVAFVLIRRKPFVAVGWLWFVGMLVPIIGLLQVGNQGLADRFTYLPGIGLMVVVIWLVADALPRTLAGRATLAIIATALVIACSLATRHLLPTWNNSDTLYQRALAVTRQNRAVHIYYGDYLLKQKRFREAIEQFAGAATLTPLDALPRFQLGLSYAEMKEYYKAQQEFECAVKLNPAYADAHFNIAVMLMKRGQPDAARPFLSKAVGLNPGAADRYNRLLKDLHSSAAPAEGAAATTRP